MHEEDPTAVLFRIDSATFVRPTGELAFEQLSWTMRGGETWRHRANWFGKTALTEVLLGRLRATAGTVEWPLLERLRAAGRSIAWPSEIVGRVAFKEDSKLFSYARHFYQQRYNFIEPDDDLTLDQFLHAGTSASEETIARVTSRLGIASLRPLSFIKMSNGQTRRARIARALLSHPEILILDEPFVGLDLAGREEVDAMLRALAVERTRIILITAPERVPTWATHVLELIEREVTFNGSRDKYREADGSQAGRASTPEPAVDAASRRAHASTLARARLPLVEMRNVNVTHGGKPILRDISWTVRAGERWAVLGPNGSGKTTLLSLICGDHPQAYSNEVFVFGVRRGGGESIWDVKRRIGLVSPEMHLYFSEPLTAERVAATGFYDVLVSRPTTLEQDGSVRELFAYFQVSDLALRPFAQLSTGQQRIVLLIRSLVKNAPLLILDEPFQVLDAVTTERARKWIDERLPGDRTVLFVTHSEAELPRTVTRRLRLDEGRVVGVE